MAGLAADTGLTPLLLFAALAGWVVVPLLAAAAAFARREL
jgi:ABC-type transport system involved in multi-copper enzyme maturation permease subunit